MSVKNKLFISAVLIAVGVAGRLLPHLWNAAPIAAIALFAGVYLGRNYALILPAIAMLASDIFIGFYGWHLALVVYASFMFTGLIGTAIGRRRNVFSVAVGSLFGSVLFYLLTNWAVWQFSPWYAHSWSGLTTCYINALPFFRNSLIGDLFYVGVIFGAYELTVSLVKLSDKIKSGRLKSI